MALSESKKVLSKLLSEENLIVEERKTDTNEAFFDTKNRLLVIPAFSSHVSEDVTDLIIGHEIGHALITKNDVWEEAIIEKGINKTILNVIEDKRVDDYIKRKYPGFRSIFTKGYKELMKMDFFGLSDIDVDELNLADKINLYTKVGHIPGITFDYEEQKILDIVENVKTFDDVIFASNELQTHMRKVFSRRFKTNKDDLLEYYYEGNDPIYGGNGSSIGGSNFAPIINAPLPLPGDPQVEHIESIIEDYTKFNNDEENIEQIYEKAEERYLDSKTDIKLKENQTTLYDNHAITSMYIDVPNIDMKRFIVDYKEIYRRLERECPALVEDNLINNEFNRFKLDNTAAVNYLLKEFRLKKNASVRKKAKINKTGEISPNKLYSYKFNEDLFLKKVKVANEQNHAMVFFLDWSSSMQKYINGTIKQLLALVMFCRKQNIPFEVYAFSSNDFYETDMGLSGGYNNSPNRFAYNNREMILDPFSLFNLLSSRMSNVEFNRASNVLLKYRHYNFYTSSDAFICNSPGWVRLGYTPLNHAIIASRQLTEEFKRKTGANIINNIFLTDGESHSIQFKYDDNSFDNLNTYYFNIYIRDKNRGLTRKIIKGNGYTETNGCLDLMKQNSDVRVMGMRIIDQRELKYKCFDLFGHYDHSGIWKRMKKEHAVKIGNNSYDEFYMIRPTDESSYIDESDYKLPEKLTTASISKAFSKSINSKIENKVILNKFIEFIS
jgi:hypothetical protein